MTTSEHMPSFDLTYANLKTLSSDPPVFTIDNFLAPSQCNHIIELALKYGDKVDTSRTYIIHQNPSENTVAASKNVRSSTTFYLNISYVEEICQKISKLTGYPTSTFEEPQVLRYKKGQYYTWHQDAIPTGKTNPYAGNRLATILIYLNPIPVKDNNNQSGFTIFQKLNLSVQPEQGKCLIFFPCFLTGAPDARTVHCSSPVLEEGEEKWMLQIWIHQRPYLN